MSVVNSIKHHWMTLSFFFGFTNDFFLLNQVDNKIDNFILLFYITLATISIILFYAGTVEKFGSKISNFLVRFMPLSMQYSFGGLLSGMLIFYGRSGSFSSSLPFFIFIVLIILINELVRKQSDRLVFNLIIYFVGIFFYSVLVLPVLIGDVGDVIFVGSGLLALFLIMLVVKILRKIIPNFIKLKLRSVVFSIGGLYVFFNYLYFTNIIPPIPLSLKELSVYQKVEKTETGYRFEKEENDDWFKFLKTEIFHPKTADGAYCFSRVYAPTKLSTTIVHRWEFLDVSNNWKEYFKMSYPINGENKGGYRGFTTIKNLENGEWRCVVENQRGQVLGIKNFIIDNSVSPKNLVTIVE